MVVPTQQDYAEEFLKKFPSNDIYEKLNKEEVSDKYDKYCVTIKSLFPKNQEIYQFCRRFARNLKEISTILSDAKDNIDRCRYFNFWKNYQIKKNHNTSNNTYDISFVRGRFFSVASMIKKESTNDACFYIYRGDISMDTWKKWKDLYDYIRNEDKIQEIINSDVSLCNLYTQYIDYINDVYEKYNDECCRDKNKNCPNHLKFDEWCNKGYTITKLECKHSEELPESLEQDSQDIESAPKGTYEGVQQIKAPDEEAEQAVFTAQAGERQDKLLDPDKDIGYSSSEPNEETTKGSETNPVGTIVGTSLGFVLPLITIYRFTPLGSWINTKIFRKDRLMENMKRNERELLLNNSGIGEMNFDNTRYQIMYNSAHNE